jgi:polyisoprenoid-binding protein YceI
LYRNFRSGQPIQGINIQQYTKQKMTKFKSLAAMALVGSLLVGSAFTGKVSGGFKVNVAKSTLKWVASKVTGKHDGTLKLASGSLESNGKMVTGGTFDIDMNSLVCTDITDKETNGKFLGHLRSEEFFSIDKHKTAHFEIQKVVPTKGNEYDVTGKLTIKGITNEVTFPATITTSPKGVKATAKITVDRTKFDIKYGSGKFFEGLGDRVINDDFTIDLNLEAGE